MFTLPASVTPPLAARSTAPPLSLTDSIVIPQGSHLPTNAIGTHRALIQPRACDLCDHKPGWVLWLWGLFRK